MVNKATYFEAHKSPDPSTLQPKLRSSNWGCAAAPGTGVTHTQHRVECSCNKLPHPIALHLRAPQLHPLSLKTHGERTQAFLSYDNISSPVEEAALG